MATDIEAVIANFRDFASLKYKNVAVIGAGGGQLIDLYDDAKNIIAIDNDKTALDKLKEKAISKGRINDYSLINQEFFESTIKSDCIVIEFCLHEIKDIEKAMIKAKDLAKEVIVLDHYWDSEWIRCVDEYDKAQEVRKYIEINRPSRIKKYKQYQVFKSYNELMNKVRSQGTNAIEYIKKFENEKDIQIEFGYIICSYN